MSRSDVIWWGKNGRQIFKQHNYYLLGIMRLDLPHGHIKDENTIENFVVAVYGHDPLRSDTRHSTWVVGTTDKLTLKFWVIRTRKGVSWIVAECG